MTIGIVLGVMIGFIFWVLASGTTIFVIVWVSISLFLFVLSIWFLYYWGKDRRKLEKLMIQESN